MKSTFCVPSINSAILPDCANRGHPTKGYSAVVAGFTAAVIINGSISIRSSSGPGALTVAAQESLSLNRIKMNFVGVA